MYVCKVLHWKSYFPRNGAQGRVFNDSVSPSTPGEGILSKQVNRKLACFLLSNEGSANNASVEYRDQYCQDPMFSFKINVNIKAIVTDFKVQQLCYNP